MQVDRPGFVGCRTLFAVGGVILMLSGCPDSNRDVGAAERTVREFLGSAGVEAKMSLLAPDFRLGLWDGEPLATRNEYRSMLAWDSVASAEMALERVEASGDTVTVWIQERNAFTELLALTPFRVESRFVVAGGGIAEQRMRELITTGSASFTEKFEAAMAPILGWAEEGAPELLAEAVGEGTIRYDGDSARALLALIRRYRARCEEEG